MAQPSDSDVRAVQVCGRMRVWCVRAPNARLVRMRVVSRRRRKPRGAYRCPTWTRLSRRIPCIICEVKEVERRNIKLVNTEFGSDRIVCKYGVVAAYFMMQMQLQTSFMSSTTSSNLYQTSSSQDNFSKVSRIWSGTTLKNCTLKLFNNTTSNWSKF